MVSYINVKTHVSFVWFSNLSRTSYHYWWYLHDFIVMQIYIFPEVRLKNSRLLAKHIYFFFRPTPDFLLSSHFQRKNSYFDCLHGTTITDLHPKPKKKIEYIFWVLFVSIVVFPFFADQNYFYGVLVLLKIVLDVVVD